VRSLPATGGHEFTEYWRTKFQCISSAKSEAPVANAITIQVVKIFGMRCKDCRFRGHIWGSGWRKNLCELLRSAG
jgi:hypothetical protein